MINHDKIFINPMPLESGFFINPEYLFITIHTHNNIIERIPYIYTINLRRFRNE